MINTIEKTNCITSNIFLRVIRLKNLTLVMPLSTNIGLKAEMKMAGKTPEINPVARAKIRNQR
jgi:hypothetical protein